MHSREDEFLHVLTGELRFYVDGEVFRVVTGECMFLPRAVPPCLPCYSTNANLTETIKVFEQYAVRFLSADEIRTVMPQYPVVPHSR